MVHTIKKWLCGVGDVLIHFCEVCGTGYEKLGKALDCEESHRE